MVLLIQHTLLFALPLMIVALAGVFAERSGIINIALEGMMVFGAFVGVLVVRLLLAAGMTDKQGQLLLIIAIVAAAIGGVLFALLLSFASINLKADQTIGGTALNLLAPAVVLFLINIICKQTTLDLDSKFSPAKLFMLRQENFGFDKGAELNMIQQILFTKVYPTTYYAIIIFVVLSVILYTTKFGLRLRSCGEHPQAADSVGINVTKMRYAGTIISGALAGFGGFIYALTSANCQVNGDVAGLGFLALAVMIFGNWKPLNIALAALLFGALKSVSVDYTTLLSTDSVNKLKSIGITSHVFRVLPYVITLVVLAFTSKKSRAPKAEGIPYDKGKR